MPRLLGKRRGERTEEGGDACGGWRSDPQRDGNLNQVRAVGTAQGQIQGHFRSRTGKNHYRLDAGGVTQDPWGKHLLPEETFTPLCSDDSEIHGRQP